MGNHDAQYLQNFSPKLSRYNYYNFSALLPKGIFIKGYPSNPKNFGKKLRKARIDAGLQVKELAERLGVVPNTLINWELRGMMPRGREIQKMLHMFVEKNK